MVLLSPQGERFNQAWAERLSREPGLTLVCGRYEGVDERVLATEVDMELSVGDVVLSGGELGAMMVLGAPGGLSRLFGVPGKNASAVRRFGMAGVQRMPGLKHWFMDEARGVSGDAPALLRG